MEDRLELVDRATLGFWRVMNVLFWGALALAVAAVIHQSVVQFFIRWFRPNWFNGSLIFNLNLRMDAGRSTVWFVLPRYFAKAIGEVLVGFAIGGIVGARVWKRQVLVAAGAALGYVLICVLFLEANFSELPLDASIGISLRQRLTGGAGWSGVTYDLVGAIAIVTALLWARHVARRHA